MELSKSLLKKINLFLKHAEMSRTTFGLNAVKDGAFLEGLENGRDIRLGTYEKVLNYINSYKYKK